MAWHCTVNKAKRQKDNFTPNSVNRPTLSLAVFSMRFSPIFLLAFSSLRLIPSLSLSFAWTHPHIYTSIWVNVSTNNAFVFSKQIQLIFRFKCRVAWFFFFFALLFLLFVFLSLLIRSFAWFCCMRPIVLLVFYFSWCSRHNCSSICSSDADFGMLYTDFLASKNEKKMRMWARDRNRTKTNGGWV